VTNHGHAGAIAGQRVAAASEAQAQAERQPSPIQQPTLGSFFVRHAGPRFPLSGEPNRPCFQARSSRSSWEQPSAELSQDGGGSGLTASEGVSLRELDAWATRTYILASDSELATHLMEHMEKWKQQLPPKGQAHPDGPARHTVAAALAQWLLKSQDRCQVMTKLAELHDSMTKLEDMSKSIQLCFAKSIRDGRILLKIRPRQSAVAAWQEAYDWIDASLDALQAEPKDVAPVGPLARDLGRKAEEQRSTE